MRELVTHGWLSIAKRRWFFNLDLKSLFERRMNGKKRQRVWWFGIKEIT